MLLCKQEEVIRLKLKIEMRHCSNSEAYLITLLTDVKISCVSEIRWQRYKAILCISLPPTSAPLQALSSSAVSAEEDKSTCNSPCRVDITCSQGQDLTHCKYNKKYWTSGLKYDNIVCGVNLTPRPSPALHSTAMLHKQSYAGHPLCRDACIKVILPSLSSYQWDSEIASFFFAGV